MMQTRSDWLKDTKTFCTVLIFPIYLLYVYWHSTRYASNSRRFTLPVLFSRLSPNVCALVTKMRRLETKFTNSIPYLPRVRNRECVRFWEFSKMAIKFTLCSKGLIEGTTVTELVTKLTLMFSHLYLSNKRSIIF